MSGNVVGQRYRIARMIGAGGMGSVHEATDAQSGARVAVKLITAEMAKNPTLMGRFAREARAAATIDTPHIVKVIDAGTDEPSGLPFLTMELLEGEDVQQLIRRLGPLAPDLALRIVAQACLGLHSAHEARIIHRDIKPANFFLARVDTMGGPGSPPNPRGQRVVKLLDFGIAKITRDGEAQAETAGLTRTGSMLGSPLYMSPEQARGHKDIDRRADIWSMGVVLYQALTGRTPHQDTDALGELIIAICTEEAVPIQELAPWVPPELAAIAHRAMRFSPAERFQTAAEMHDAIRPLLPSGWAIDETMFQPMGDADRGQVQPRLVTLPDTPVPRGARTHPSNPAPARGSTSRSGVEGATPLPVDSGYDGGSRPATPGALPLAAPERAGASIQAYGTTVGRGAPSTAPAPAGSGGRTAILAAAAVAIVGLAGAGAWRLTSGAAVAPGLPPEALPSVVVAPVVAPVTMGAPAPNPLAEVKPRTVKVVVLPEDAAVEVDGAAVKANEGAIEITGAIGSVHKVKVTTGEGEALRDVVITEEGAIPPKVEGPAAKPSAGKAPPPRAPGGPAPSPFPPPSASPLRLQR